MQHEVAGDPITGIRWTHRTTDHIAKEAAILGIQVCTRTVARSIVLTRHERQPLRNYSNRSRS